MVAQGRRFTGRLPLAVMARLAPSLAATSGDIRFDLEFGRDRFGAAFVAVVIEGCLPLICQRSLEIFDWPVRIDTRLGLIRTEPEEAALPPGYEPLLVGAEAMRLADVVEDELILALPLVPMQEGSVEAEGMVWSSELDQTDKPNPFAVLSVIKQH